LQLQLNIYREPLRDSESLRFHSCRSLLLLTTKRYSRNNFKRLRNRGRRKLRSWSCSSRGRCSS